MYGSVADVSYGMPSSPADCMFSFFVGLSTVSFLFGSQAIQPDIQAALKAKDGRQADRSYMRAFYSSYAITIPLYYASAIAGYLTFGEAVNSMILTSISQNSTSSVVTGLVTAAQISVTIHTVVAYQVCSGVR